MAKDLDTQQADAIQSLWGLGSAKRWDELADQHRVVVLADAGAGKTFEFRAQAERMRSQDKLSFFLRIEDITSGVADALEVGTPAELEGWLTGTGDAWLFLDSVDEARLDSPRAFEKALLRLKDHIHDAQLRAHIFISSRPYAWRASSDPALIERLLPFPLSAGAQDGTGSDEKTELFIYWLNPLDEEAVRFYARHRDIGDVDGLIAAIHRSELWSVAERPFDLEDILAKWDQDRTLGTRLELLRYGIRSRLVEIDPDRSERQPLRFDQALAGARLLAAAVTFTGMAGIRVSDGLHNAEGIDPDILLRNWHPAEIKALLARALFNDAIYGMVRFRHREVRELLAAEWVRDLLAGGASRHAIEALFLREQYGEIVFAPRLRALLPWLILFDDKLRDRSLALDPAIATEGGDPAQLPLAVRRAILNGVIEQIVASEGTSRVGDNAAIARIAQEDLASDTLNLIERHKDNDDAIFFLARLVWQGEMRTCLDALVPIALDSQRGIYSRMVSVRAVANVGGPTRRLELWKSLTCLGSPLDRRLLTELLQGAPADLETVDLLLATLPRLPPYERFGATGLCGALHQFIDNLPVDASGAAQPLSTLVTGLNALLDEPPYVETECEVSEKYRWLIGTATHAAERLIAARALESLEPATLAVLLKVPALRLWRNDDDVARKTDLSEQIPMWPELNDALFWACVEEHRQILKRKGERLTDDWPLSWIGHFWRFDEESFDRILSWIEDRANMDDRLVALGRALRTYVQYGRPEAWLTRLKAICAEDTALADALDCYLSAPDPEVLRLQWAENRKFARKIKRRERAEKQGHENWLRSVRSNSDRVRHPVGLESGQMTNDQWWLLQAINEDEVRTNRSHGVNWRALIPQFGEEVATAYRDAAIAKWRTYRPGLRSEGDDTNSTPGALIFAMAGLGIEATESDRFPDDLSEHDVRHAFRYAFWELNGFPPWFEQLYRSYPVLGLAAIRREVIWELENSPAETPIHYVLHDLVYHTPWLHTELAPVLQDWLEQHDAPHSTALRYCLHILIEGKVPGITLAALAKTKIEQWRNAEQRPQWYALWADTDPDAAIPAIERELEGMDGASASPFAQYFIVALAGSRHDRNPTRGGFQTPAHLKSLYALVHRYVRASDDIERAGKGVYSPTLRDNAQDARNQLFNWLSEMPGKPTYVAIAELARDHPDPDSRKWMKLRARERALADSDLTPWTVEQLREFADFAELKPATHRQLFDLLVSKMVDLKGDLEGGNLSIAQTLQRIPNETEMRNIMAHLLSERSNGRYALAQEAELANAQRPDIWLQITGNAAPIPIEVKLLDKRWSGPALCERLRNQLVGDYLRDRSASCGIMLLVWQGRAASRRWRFGGSSISLDHLSDALEAYWRSIADRFPDVEEIKVFVIDLSKRSRKSVSG